MFCLRSKTLQKSHKCDCFIDAKTASALEPCGIIGSVCLKSPPNSTVLPPKGWSLTFGSLMDIKSRSVLSRASNACRFVIGKSNAAMPEEATGSTIFFSDRNLEIMVL
ncbi:hypothetical protein YC2023_042842 [Brassica napus]